MSLEQKIEILNNEKIPQVYEAGQKSMVDESKIIEKIVSGVGLLHIDDVSEVPHKVNIQLSSDTITDFSDMNVTICKKNLFDYSEVIESGHFIELDHETGEIELINNSNIIPITNIPKCAKSLYCSFEASSTSNSQVYLKLIYSDGTKGSMSTQTNKSGEWVQSSNFNINNGKTITGIEITGDSGIKNGTKLRKILLRYNTTDKEYEPYNGITYKSNLNGMVNEMNFLSPCMAIYSNAEVNIAVNYHKSYGIQLEYDNFWDNYQDYGNRTDYEYAFRTQYWNDKNFKPKYNINATTYDKAMFYNCNITNLTKILEEAGVVLNTFKLQETFRGAAKMTHIPTVTLSSGILYYTFAWCNNLVSIEKLVITKESGSSHCEPFLYCRALTDLTIEGTIGLNGFDVQYSTKLSKDSITSIINALSSNTTGLTVTLSKTAVNNAFNINVDDETTYPEGSEYYTLRHSKDNWTISYV